MRPRGYTALACLVLICTGAPCHAQGQGGAPSESLLFAWLKDNDAAHPAFLAVIDADPASGNYGQVLTTATAGMPLEDAHHTPHALPSNGRLFANAFRDGRTFIFDVSRPNLPRRIGSFERVGEYSYPHSFIELENGNFLVTFQSSGSENDQPGGLIELDPDGVPVRTAPAADPDTTEFIRPYSLEVFPDLDRVISSSADMWGTRATEHLQLWRLSDLSLLGTFALPEGERRNIMQIPLEIRAVGDGRSAYAVTWNCGLYHLEGIGGTSLRTSLVWDFSASACAIPVRIGDYWIQAVGEAWQVVVLDISDPAAPQLATVLQFPEGHQPHWIAAEPNGERIVVTGYGALADRIVLLSFNPGEQSLEMVAGFGNSDTDPPGVLTDRRIWPHGKTGPATPHAVVFWPAAPEPEAARSQ